MQPVREQQPHTERLPVVTLRRLQTGVQGTFGLVTCPGAVLTSAELPWRGNRRQVSCIPPGAYRCAWRRSPRFGDVYHVEDVPGRSAVLIHPGNLVGDAEVGLDTHSQGCILLGEKFGLIRNTKGMMQRAILVSRPAVRVLAAAMREQPFILEVT